ncbi:hypothetical protein N7478_008280 [Penicillium angulare]|uniref:uncharacterized protein n=1 Tax=Penicillium angulare TaxID=116970 RepID=UPI00254039BC|nr:uncharacterized protein N7478_008280 [Penicillium angulare]KAJ5273155.1 hypothetical protein N7478_008280 [Penicillium angulare]
MNSITFGSSNHGFQVGMNHGQIRSSEFDFPTARPRTSRNPSFTVPFRRDNDFIVDQKLLDQVSSKLSIPGSRVALAGLGGIG